VRFYRSFTLLELVVVIIIIGMLSTLGVSQYSVMREKALDKEAISNLKLIISAEKIYRMENSSGGFPESDDTENNAQINDVLKLSLPLGHGANWRYRVFADNAAVPPTCCAEAGRMILGDPITYGRAWHLRNTDDEPSIGECS